MATRDACDGWGKEGYENYEHGYIRVQMEEKMAGAKGEKQSGKTINFVDRHL